MLLFILTLVPGRVELITDSFTYTGYGANMCVSGSMHLVEINGERVILDAGSFFADEGSTYGPLSPEVLDNVKALLVSHAHLDHTGRIPLLINLGYENPIYCTPPTREFLQVMLAMIVGYEDFGQETFFYSRAVRAENKKNNRDTPVHSSLDCLWGGRIKDENLDTLSGHRPELSEEGFYLCRFCAQGEVKEIMKQVIPVEMGEKFKVTNNLNATFYGTPHIPGSAMVLLESEVSGASLLYTGDFGSGNSPFLPEQDFVDEANLIIVEGTYGTRPLDRDISCRLIFQDYLGKQVMAERRIFIASPVLDRTQQVLNEIRLGKESGRIPEETEVYVVGTSAIKINDIYRKMAKNPDYHPYFSRNFFQEPPLKLSCVEKRKPVDIEPGQIVICSPASMLGGYSRDYLLEWIWDSESVFIFVGYLCPDSPPGMALKGAKTIKVEGKTYGVNATLKNFHCFQSHGDYGMIKEFVEGIEGLKAMLIVHANALDAETLKKSYISDFPYLNVIVPEPEKEYLFQIINKISEYGGESPLRWNY